MVSLGTASLALSSPIFDDEDDFGLTPRGTLALGAANHASLEDKEYEEMWDDDVTVEEFKELIAKFEDVDCEHPLFMTQEEFDEARERGDNQFVNAMDAAVADEIKQDPMAYAMKLKGQGNTFFKRGKQSMPVAIRCYTGALDILHKKIELEAMPYDLDELYAVQSALLGNRAAANMKLGNYRMCVHDCKAAFDKDPRNAKALLRAATCSLKLGKIPAALHIAEKGIEQCTAINAGEVLHGGEPVS